MCICTQYYECLLTDDIESEDFSVVYMPGEVYEFWTETNKLWGEIYHVKNKEHTFSFSASEYHDYNFNKFFRIL